MSTAIYSFYKLDTGLFTGARFHGMHEWLSMNRPDGCGFLLGEFDHLRQRVDTDTGQVLDYIPPAPPSTEFESYEWDTNKKQWEAKLSPAGKARAHNKPLDIEITQLEYQQMRSLREAVVALSKGQPVPEGALTKLTKLESDVSSLRQRRK